MTKAEEVMPFLADPKRQEEDAHRQHLRRQSFSRARLSPASRMVSRGIQFERMARKALERGDSITAKRQLAHGLHLQGRYLEAAEIAPDEVSQQHYRGLQEAIEIDDTLCNCPRKEVDDPLTEKKLSISPRRHLKDVYSPKHGDVVALMGCENGCPLNARPLAGQAREIANTVNESHRVARDARKRSLDNQVLKEKS